MPGKLRLQLRGLKRRALLEINQPTKFGKVDLIHLISRLRTPTTGNYYGEIQRWRFDTARRLMYNCPDGFDDGLICLVDEWHTYDCTIRDLMHTTCLQIAAC